jgi:hypothetical protein
VEDMVGRIIQFLYRGFSEFQNCGGKSGGRIFKII